MKFKATFIGLAAIGLATAPVAAQAALGTRASAPVVGASEVEGSSAVILAILAAAAVIGGIIIAADDNQPTSP